MALNCVALVRKFSAIHFALMGSPGSNIRSATSPGAAAIVILIQRRLTTGEQVKKKEAIALVSAEDIRIVRFLYCDPSGVIRGKTVHGSQFAGKVTEGVGLTRAQNAVNLFEDLIPVDGMEPIG